MVASLAETSNALDTFAKLARVVEAEWPMVDGAQWCGEHEYRLLKQRLFWTKQNYNRSIR